MVTWIIRIMNQFGYWGLLLLVILENLVPPIPSEVILPFGGFMTTMTNLSTWGVILVSTAGSVIGAVILYTIGYLLPPERLDRWLNGITGRLLHYKPGDLLKASDKFNKQGQYSVLFCRLLPTVRSLISIPAGMAKMNMWKFIFFSTVGSAIWNAILVYLGAAAGASWPRVIEYVKAYSTITVILLATLLVCGVCLLLTKRLIHSR